MPMYFDPAGTGKLKPSLRQGAAVITAGLMAIRADGWSGDYASPPAAFDPVGNPQVVLLNRQGFDASGNATVYAEGLIITQRVRVPYTSAYASATSYLNANLAANGLLTPNRVALNDFVYATDTVAGGSSAANNSTVASPVPIAQWARPDARVVGATMPKEALEVSAFHRNARGGEQIACVVWTIKDINGLTVTVKASASVVSGHAFDQQAVIVYRPSADVDISSLADGALAVNAKVYPWIGGATSVMDSATGTLNAVDGKFNPQQHLKSVSLAASPRLIYVDATNGTSSGIASTDPSAASASPVPDVASAVAKLRSTFGSDLGGCRIRLKAGTAVVGSVAFTSWATNVAALVIEPDPATAASTPSAASAAVLSLDANKSIPGAGLRFLGITINRTGTSQISTSIAGGIVAFESVAYQNGGNATLCGSGIKYRILGMVVSGTAIGSGLNPNLGRGILATSVGNASSYAFLGCSFTGGVYASYASNQIFAFNKAMLLTTLAFNAAGTADVNGLAIAQNVLEYTSATANPLVKLSGDGATGNTAHVVIFNNTMVGSNGRGNLFYNEGSTARTHTLVASRGNIHIQVNTKHDVFYASVDATEAPNRVGGWPFMYGVGSDGEVATYTDSNATQNGLGGMFGQAFAGIRYLAGASGVPIDPKFTSYQASLNGAAGSGNGNYRLQSGSPVASLLANPVLKFDLDGLARKAANDSAGAYVGAAA